MSLIVRPTLLSTFIQRVVEDGPNTAFMYREKGLWRNVTWVEYEKKVIEISWALKKLGIKSKDRICLISKNNPNWQYCDLAIMSLGAVVVPIYDTLSAEEIFEIIQKTEAKMILVEDVNQREKIQAIRKSLSSEIIVVSFDTPKEDEQILSLSQLLSDVRKQVASEEEMTAEWRLLANHFPVDHPCTMVFTGGVEGKSKASLLTHQNFMFVLEELSVSFSLNTDDISMMILPSANVMGRIESMLNYVSGLKLVYVSSLKSFVADIKEVKPTLLMAVPRVFEKVYLEFSKKSDTLSASKRLVARWAIQVGEAVSERLQSGQKIPLYLNVQKKIAENIVLSKVKDIFGGSLRFAVSGGASLNRELLEFYHACGILILEAYGLTEATGPVTVNTPGAYRFGSVGRPLRKVELAFSQDQEILVKGPNIVQKYEHLETQENYFEFGFLKTGDRGHLDEDGFLILEDRIKDTIVLSTGRNIYPAKIENLITLDPLISQAFVFGESKPNLVALLSLDSVFAQRLAEEHKIAYKSYEDLLTQKDFVQIIQESIDSVNERLATFECVRKFKILPRAFSVEAGELSPSFKPRRKFLAQKFVLEIEELFS